jgi:hypothetical protein
MGDYAFHIFATGLLDGVLTDGCCEKPSVFASEPSGLSKTGGSKKTTHPFCMARENKSHVHHTP